MEMEIRCDRVQVGDQLRVQIGDGVAWKEVTDTRPPSITFLTTVAVLIDDEWKPLPAEGRCTVDRP